MDGLLPGYSKLDTTEEKIVVPKKKSFRALFKHVSSKHSSRNSSRATTSSTSIPPPHTSSSSPSPSTSVRLPDALYTEVTTDPALSQDFTDSEVDTPVHQLQRPSGLDTSSQVSITTNATTTTTKSTRSSSLSNSHAERDRITFHLGEETTWCSEDLSRESTGLLQLEDRQPWPSADIDTPQRKCDDATPGTSYASDPREADGCTNSQTGCCPLSTTSQTAEEVLRAHPAATGQPCDKGSSLSLHSQARVDTVLTQTKVLELGHDVMRLEGAIRVNENQRKDLDDWLFDQMAAVRSGEPMFTAYSLTDAMASPSSAAMGIRSVYDEKMHALHSESKALHSRLDYTQYVLGQLGIQGFPLGTSPKLYVQELLRQRGKPRAPVPAVGNKKDSAAIAPTSGHQHSHLFNTNTPRSILTLPVQFSARSPLHLDSMVTRLTKTLPAGGFPTESTTLPIFTKQESTQHYSLLARKQSDPAFCVTTHQSRPAPPAPPAIMSPGSEELKTTTPGYTTRPLQSTRYSAHPTSSDLLVYQRQHHHHPHHTQGEEGSFPVACHLPASVHMTSSSLGKPPIMSPTRSGHYQPSVLNSFRHGFENLSRRLPWSSKMRSASEEQLSTSISEKPHSDRSWKPSLIPNWPHSLKKTRKSKNHSLSSTNHHLQQSPTSFPPDMPNQQTAMDSCSQLGVATRNPSYSISNSSTNGLIPPLPSEEAGTRSTSGWLGDEVPITNGDQLLSRIFNLLAESTAVAAAQPRGAHGSSGSSASVIGVPTSLASNGRSQDTQQQQQHCAPSTPTAAIGQAFMLYHRFQDSKMTAVAQQQAEYFRELRDELLSLKYQHVQLHNTLNNVTAELDSLRRDVTTADELHQQRLTNALTRIDQLDANAENSKQDLHCALINLGNKMTSKVESMEYQLTTKTRDLDDNVTSLSNKVSIIEKPMDSHSQSFANSSELSRMGRKVLHYLIDLSISLFALVTMLLQLLIRFLNLGAVITENRTLAVFLTTLLLVCVSLVYLSGPLLDWIQPDQIHRLHRQLASPSLPVLNGDAALPLPMVDSSLWRSAIISFLNFFHRFVAR